MPATFIQDAETTISSTATQAKTTTAFNVQAGDLLVALATAGRSDSPLLPLTISDSVGLIWTKRTEQQVGTSTEYVAIWTAPCPSSQTGMTVTFTKGNATTSMLWGGSVQTWRGASGVGNAASGSELGTATVGLTTTGPNSAIALAHTQGGTATSSPTFLESAGAFTPTLQAYSSFSYSVNHGYYADVGAAGAKTVGVSDPTFQEASVAAIELLGATAPTVTAELYEGGVLKASLGTAEVSADGVVSFTWDAAALAALSGANVELRLTSDLDLDVGAIEWNAWRDPAGGPPPPTLVETWGSVAM